MHKVAWQGGGWGFNATCYLYDGNVHNLDYCLQWSCSQYWQIKMLFYFQTTAQILTAMCTQFPEVFNFCLEFFFNFTSRQVKRNSCGRGDKFIFGCPSLFICSRIEGVFSGELCKTQCGNHKLFSAAEQWFWGFLGEEPLFYGQIVRYKQLDRTVGSCTRVIWEMPVSSGKQLKPEGM